MSGESIESRAIRAARDLVKLIDEMPRAGEGQPEPEADLRRELKAVSRAGRRWANPTRKRSAGQDDAMALAALVSLPGWAMTRAVAAAWPVEDDRVFLHKNRDVLNRSLARLVAAGCAERRVDRSYGPPTVLFRATSAGRVTASAEASSWAARWSRFRARRD